MNLSKLINGEMDVSEICKKKIKIIYLISHIIILKTIKIYKES